MSRAGKSRDVADYHNEFVEEVRKATAIGPASYCETGKVSSVDNNSNENGCDAKIAEVVNVLDVKVRNAFNGLETSTFTVCTRIRPALDSDNIGSGENFTCIVPATPVSAGKDYCEPTLVLVPKVSMLGKAKLEPTSLNFDYTFGPDASGSDIFDRVGDPLVQRCLAGQVGVVFAYGQTGSGKVSDFNLVYVPTSSIISYC